MDDLRAALDEESSRCARALLALAAMGVQRNALAKLLLRLEWSCPTTVLVHSTIKTKLVCPSCHGLQPTHNENCDLDKALVPFREEDIPPSPRCPVCQKLGRACLDCATIDPDYGF